MSKKPKIVSAGGVVLREHTAGLQVLLIHRERYDDWSLPKGKGEADELLPETAVREIREETGVAARLGLRLPSLRYKVGKQPKAVHYWRSAVLSQRPRRPDHEVSAVKWFPVEAALGKLTHPDERAVVEAALEAALRSGTISGAGIDVTDPEPLPASSTLWDAPNLLLTPHAAGGRVVGAVERIIANAAAVDATPTGEPITGLEAQIPRPSR